MAALLFRRAKPEDAPRLQAIRAAAFAPIFNSFRNLLGEEVYDLAQRRSDEAQSDLLTSLLTPDSGWELYVALSLESTSAESTSAESTSAESTVGFVSVRLDPQSLIGEIGLNAVDPARAGAGIGTAMYEFALARMKEAGMKVATVGTGGDPSHAPARRAYAKAGFNLQIPSVWMCRKL